MPIISAKCHPKLNITCIIFLSVITSESIKSKNLPVWKEHEKHLPPFIFYAAKPQAIKALVWSSADRPCELEIDSCFQTHSPPFPSLLWAPEPDQQGLHKQAPSCPVQNMEDIGRRMEDRWRMKFGEFTPPHLSLLVTKGHSGYQAFFT